MAQKRSRMPRARKEELAVQAVADELLVYDLENQRAHCLNKTAALVWRLCDGKTGLTEMARILHEKLDMPADQEVVRFALGRLRKAHLLQGQLDPAIGSSRYSRREFVRKLKKLGLAASVMLPVVSSIVSPTPAYAASCVPKAMCVAVPDCTPCMGKKAADCNTKRCCNGKCDKSGKKCGC